MPSKSRSSAPVEASAEHEAQSAAASAPLAEVVALPATQPVEPKKAPAKRRPRTAAKKKQKVAAAGKVVVDVASGAEEPRKSKSGPEVRVRRMHRRDLNRTWEFLKLVFRGVNRETVEYQRPRSKRRFVEVYEVEGEQLLFEVDDRIVGYAECAFDVSGADNWINPRYFEKRGMRPLYVEELAVHPDYQGKGVGGFMLDQLQHLARVRGCTHLVLEVAENNQSALTWYRKRNFFKLDAAIFLAQKVPAEPELLPPRRLQSRRGGEGSPTTGLAPAGRKPAVGTRRAPKPGSSARARRR